MLILEGSENEIFQLRVCDENLYLTIHGFGNRFCMTIKDSKEFLELLKKSIETAEKNRKKNRSKKVEDEDEDED